MRRYLLSFALSLGAGLAHPPANLPKADLLWPDGAPESQGIEDIDKPSLAPYLVPAGRGTGTAVIVCPGGGYGHLAMDHEGDQAAKWLNSLGVSRALAARRSSSSRWSVVVMPPLSRPFSPFRSPQTNDVCSPRCVTPRSRIAFVMAATSAGD